MTRFHEPRPTATRKLARWGLAHVRTRRERSSKTSVVPGAGRYSNSRPTRTPARGRASPPNSRTASVVDRLRKREVSHLLLSLQLSSNTAL